MFGLSIFLPFISSAILFFFGRFLGKFSSMCISISLIVVAFVSAATQLYEVCFLDSPCYVCVGLWFSFRSYFVGFGFNFDSLSVFMFVVVTFVSFVVHVYALDYMAHDAHVIRFFSYLSGFTGFMLFLVAGDNLFQVFIGWEGVGVMSYLLINFWSNRVYANRAALKAMLFNRVGDLGFCVGAILVFLYSGTVHFSSLALLLPSLLCSKICLFGYNVDVFELVGFCFILAAAGKSAQIGLHTWLPDAMEGPTPVSALLHAATMVTAGVFLVVRLAFLFSLFSHLQDCLLLLGSLTAVFASFIACFQYDIKRIIAYSTCSQLGIMFVGCGLGAYDYSMFHLFNHAFFKALLFMCAGMVVHSLGEEQDIRRMGSLCFFLPVTYVCMFIASLSLAGFPGFSGSFSKEPILILCFLCGTVASSISFWLLLVSFFFTSFYSFRLLFLVFWVRPNGFRCVYSNIDCETASPFMLFSIILLVFPSLFSGFCFSDFLVGYSSIFWVDGLGCYVDPTGDYLFVLHVFSNYLFLPCWVYFLPLFVSLVGGLFGVFIFSDVIFFWFTGWLRLSFDNSSYFSVFVHYFSEFYMSILCFGLFRGYFDFLYGKFFYFLIFDIGYWGIFCLLDKLLLEFFGSRGAFFIRSYVWGLCTRVYYTSLQSYVIRIVGSLLFIMVFLFFV